MTTGAGFKQILFGIPFLYFIYSTLFPGLSVSKVNKNPAYPNRMVQDPPTKNPDMNMNFGPIVVIWGKWKIWFT